MSQKQDVLEEMDWELEEELALLATEVVPPVALRHRLMDSVQEQRWAPFWDRAARLLQVSAEQAQKILDRIQEVWDEHPFPGVELLHLAVGPAALGADVGLVRMQPGAAFPYHSHSQEIVLVLQGGFEDDDGQVYRAGAWIEREGGHQFRALSEEVLIYLVVVYDLKMPC